MYFFRLYDVQVLISYIFLNCLLEKFTHSPTLELIIFKIFTNRRRKKIIFRVICMFFIYMWSWHFFRIDTLYFFFRLPFIFFCLFQFKLYDILFLIALLAGLLFLFNKLFFPTIASCTLSLFSIIIFYHTHKINFYISPLILTSYFLYIY